MYEKQGIKYLEPGENAQLLSRNTILQMTTVIPIAG